MNATPATRSPVFIHSLFRTASTYFFNKFRGLGPAFTCYQEPFNEILGVLNDRNRQDELLTPPDYEVLRHPSLDKPYFYEFWSIRTQLKGLFRDSFSYEHYYIGDGGTLPSDQLVYVATLIEWASGRPMLQFCRSAGRMTALKRAFGGLHIHLWREPRIQWWSYKVNDYFDKANQRIYASKHLPPALQQVAAAAAIVPGKLRQSDARSSYMAFYGLWLDAWLRMQPAADLSIGIDAAAASAAEAQRVSQQLGERLGHVMDLTDFKARGMCFTAREHDFYGAIEEIVDKIFLDTQRCGAEQLRRAGDAATQARAAHENLAHDAATERNLRQAALAMMDRLAEADRSRWRGPLPYGLAKLRSYW